MKEVVRGHSEWKSTLQRVKVGGVLSIRGQESCTWQTSFPNIARMWWSLQSLPLESSFHLGKKENLKNSNFVAYTCFSWNISVKQLNQKWLSKLCSTLWTKAQWTQPRSEDWVVAVHSLITSYYVTLPFNTHASYLELQLMITIVRQ